MLIKKCPVDFLVDSGASVNLLPMRYASSVEPTSKTLKVYNDAEMKPIIACRISIRNPKNSKKYSVEFLVVDDKCSPILGHRAAEQMGLITVNRDTFHVLKLSDSVIMEKYVSVFDDELGSFSGEQHLHVSSEATPVVMPATRIPLSVRPQLKAELDRLVEKGVITPVDEPTPWVSQLVVTVKESGALRLCLNPQELNRVLQREHYTMPVLEDVLHELSQSTVFSKADCRNGFWHVCLDKESSFLTTFQTNFGRYRWLRLPFGASVSSEIFQKKLIEALQGLPGVVCVADDIIIHGSNLDQHDRHLEGFLNRCRDVNIKLNKEKFQLRMSEKTYMGHIVTGSGLKLDPDKVKAIQEMKPPTDVQGLRRFLGLVNYLSKFIPNM